MTPSESDQLTQLRRDFEVWRRTSPAGSAIPAKFLRMPIDNRVFCRVPTLGSAASGSVSLSTYMTGSSLVVDTFNADSGMP